MAGTHNDGVIVLNFMRFTEWEVEIHNANKGEGTHNDGVSGLYFMRFKEWEDEINNANKGVGPMRRVRVSYIARSLSRIGFLILRTALWSTWVQDTTPT